MTAPRTSHFTIFLRYLLLASPFAIPLGCILSPWLGPFLLGFFITLAVVWFVIWGLTNLFTYATGPDDYNTIIEAGGDPFHDSLGAPLNFDSEEVRCQGTFDEEELPMLKPLGPPKRR